MGRIICPRIHTLDVIVVMPQVTLLTVAERTSNVITVVGRVTQSTFVEN